MTKQELDKVIENHLKWLQNKEGGIRANLFRADLSGANLFRANLFRANLSGANLSGADLSGANLFRANLSGADLFRADLSGANLSGANLFRADLSGANLSGANLSGASLSNLQIQRLSILPQSGGFVGWKKAKHNAIVKLRIPARAKRSNAPGSRKCRASEAKVLAVFPRGSVAISQHDPNFVYNLGTTVRPTQPFSENFWEECASGIHFFLSREEAEAY